AGRPPEPLARILLIFGPRRQMLRWATPRPPNLPPMNNWISLLDLKSHSLPPSLLTMRLALSPPCRPREGRNSSLVIISISESMMLWDAIRQELPSIRRRLQSINPGLIFPVSLQISLLPHANPLPG